MADEITRRGDLLEFPCQFPIKMMGRDQGDFRATVVSLVERHAGTIDDDAVRVTPSSKGNFISVTITIEATSQEQLDAIYQDLTDHEDVLVSL